MHFQDVRGEEAVGDEHYKHHPNLSPLSPPPLNPRESRRGSARSDSAETSAGAELSLSPSWREGFGLSFKSNSSL